MLSIRKVRTASGPVAVQVVQYLGHKSVILKHIGSGKNGEEVFSLVKKPMSGLTTEQDGPPFLLSHIRKF
jgi:hypothetical protein